MPIEVDIENYFSFLGTRSFAVLHFDAAWDVGGREATRRAVRLAEREFGADVTFGEADVDHPAVTSLARMVGLGNVPLVVYYRSYRLVAALVGAGQNVPERTRRLIRGEPIGYDDGTGTLIKPE